MKKHHSSPTNKTPFSLPDYLLISMIVFAVLAIGIGWYYNFIANGDSKSTEILGQSEILASPVSAAIDPVLNLSVDKNWILLGQEFTDQEKSLAIKVDLTSTQSNYLSNKALPAIQYEIIESSISGEMGAISDQEFASLLNVSTLSPGVYHVKVSLHGPDFVLESKEYEFYVSYPLYVSWTMDWEGYDVKQEYLDAMISLSMQFGVPITHFFNPRIYTNPEIPIERQAYLTRWIIDRQENSQDAIGLHLHAFPDMVRAAGIKPVADPVQWGSSLSDGYDVLLMQYDQAQIIQMLLWSKQIFEEKGLPEPVMFRAGGWFANEEVLKSLDETGFKLDSSGRTSYTFGQNQIQGPWELEVTTMPYHPDENDQNASGPSPLEIWEFPNNGADSWAFTAEQMIGRFEQNRQGFLTEKRIVTYLSHPEWFNVDQSKLEELFNHVNQFSYSQDQGPVVFITLEQAYKIWE